MASITQDLSISGENVQRLYNFYIANRFVVNRRYQRKLVWSVEEKRNFIDSLIKSYPTPIILLAELKDDGERKFEIIDGMQRLNAIASFIEGEFQYNSGYFNLQTMAESKDLLDKGLLQQAEPALDRDLCLRLASYNVALSVYRFENQVDVDEVFRRINANGRVLSAHELRAAGALGNLAQLVRRISTDVRGDVTATDILRLNDMKLISITNKSLTSYGIEVEDIFWVKQGVLNKDNVRQSRDEELVQTCSRTWSTQNHSHQETKSSMPILALVCRSVRVLPAVSKTSRRP